MNGIHRDFNLSSKGVNFRHSGFTGKFILLALKQTGNFPSLRFEWQVELTHSVLSTLALPVIHTSIDFCALGVHYLLSSHFVTDDQYHN